MSPALGRTLMSSYRYRFVGYEKLPSGLNADDVQLHCRLPDRLVKEIRDSNYAKRYYLGLAVQLSFLALTGRNPDSKLRMPTAMLRLLCEQLGIHANTTAIVVSQGAVPERRSHSRQPSGLGSREAWPSGLRHKRRRAFASSTFSASHRCRFGG